MHTLDSVASPSQLLPVVQFLIRLSTPRPQVTEHDQGSQDDQTTKKAISDLKKSLNTGVPPEFKCLSSGCCNMAL